MAVAFAPQSKAQATHAPLDRHSHEGSYIIGGVAVLGMAGAGAFLLLKGKSSTTTPPTTVPGGPTITTTSLPAATAGTAYSASLAASGGTPPYTWTGTGLPAGLTLSSSGAISGTPTATTSAFVTVSVTCTDSAGLPSTAQFTITVNVVGTDQVSTSSLPAGVVGQAYSAALQGSGGTPPYSWSATGLPAGLSLSQGVITGTPTAAGTSQVGITMTDSSTPTPVVATATLSLAVTGGFSPVSGTVYDAPSGQYVYVSGQMRGFSSPTAEFQFGAEYWPHVSISAAQLASVPLGAEINATSSTPTFSPTSGVVYSAPSGQYVYVGGQMRGFSSPTAEAQYGAEYWPHVSIAAAQLASVPSGAEINATTSTIGGSSPPTSSGCCTPSGGPKASSPWPDNLLVASPSGSIYVSVWDGSAGYLLEFPTAASITAWGYGGYAFNYATCAELCLSGFGGVLASTPGSTGTYGHAGVRPAGGGPGRPSSRRYGGGRR